MNAFGTSVVVLLGGFVLYEGLRYLAIQNMTFVLASVTPSQSGLTTTLNIVVQVQNPSPQSNTLDSLSGVVYLNGSYVANVLTAGPQVIPGNSQTPVSLIAELDDVNVISAVLSTLGAGITKGTVTFIGSAGVDSFKLPVTLTYELI